MHHVGRGALDIWLRLLLRDVTEQQVGEWEVREDLQSDINKEVYRTNRAAIYDASEMTPGVLCMYFVQAMLTTGSCQLRLLRAGSRRIQGAGENGMPTADYCRYMAQFCFTADSNVGDLLSPDVMREHNSDPRASH